MSVHAQVQKTRITLNMIETLTYSCQNAEQLAIASTKLQDIFDTLKSATHQTEGVVIRPLITKRADSFPTIQKPVNLAKTEILRSTYRTKARQA